MTDLATIADAVDALTNPIQVREPIYDQIRGHRQLKRMWIATVPSLITQLRAAVQPGVAYQEDEGSGGRSTPRSIPPARIDAVSALLRIEAAAGVWCNRADIAWRESLTANLRALVGAQLHSDDQAELLTDLRHWYGWASVLSGWQRPPWRPDAACPVCETKHSLRVRLERKTAVCVDCGVVWTENEIGLLAEHVRQQGMAGEARHVGVWSGAFRLGAAGTDRKAAPA
jgi:hypothetical protein